MEERFGDNTLVGIGGQFVVHRNANGLFQALRRPFLVLLLTGAAISLFPVSAFGNGGAQIPKSGTVHFLFDGNRVYAELAFVPQDGTVRNALAFVDLGSPKMIVSKALFNQLGLDQKKPVAFLVGEMPVTLEPAAIVYDPWLPFPMGENRQIEALLPAGVVKNYQLVIDYASQTLTLALPGVLKPEATPVPIHIDRKTGLAAVDATIDGKSYPITIDNGSAFTWLRKATAQKWLKIHPDWVRGIGAVGKSNMRMADDGVEATAILTRIPEVRLGALRIHDVGALAIGPGANHRDLIDWYRNKNTVPVIGWLGGNVLQGFRIMIPEVAGWTGIETPH